METDHALDSLFGRIFYGKPVSTFPENALAQILIGGIRCAIPPYAVIVDGVTGRPPSKPLARYGAVGGALARGFRKRFADRRSSLK
ncbi:MAG: hypothetical protein ABSD08_17215, partial [Xanthobacteraceae bacterium]